MPKAQALSGLKMVTADPAQPRKQSIATRPLFLMRGWGLGIRHALPVSQILPLPEKMGGGGRGNREIESLHEELEHILLF